jgi:hypothetical protein
MVKVILDDVLAAPGDENELFDARLFCFLNRILNDRLVDDGKHLLGHRLGGWKKARSHAGDRKNRFSHRFRLGHDAPGLWA